MLNWPHFTHGLAYEWRRIRKQSPFRLLFKVCSHCGSLILWFLLLPLTIILHVAGYRRVTVFTDRIGHLALEPDCLLKEQALGRIRSRKWLMLAPPGRIANEHLLTYWQPHFSIVRGRIACFLIASMSRWGLMRYDVSRYIIAANKAHDAYRIYALWNNHPPLLALIQADDEWGMHALHKLGLPDGAWFACIHIRGPGFSPIDEELHAHRNSSIEATIPAIQEITRRGGWVIRIGDPTMQQLPSLPQTIDYAHHPMKCDRLDIILCAKARFILGNTSGIALVGTVFGVPCALANVIPVSTLWFNACDISIPKLLWSERLARHLRFDESASSPVAEYRYAKLYQEAGIRVDENSAEDIRNLVREMLDRLNGCFELGPEDEARLRRVEPLFNRSHYAYGAAAGISVSFLRNHPELLPPP